MGVEGSDSPVKGSLPLVLVVDDYRDTREMTTEFLSYYGYRTVVAETGLEAIEQALKHRPAVILMDLGLPKMDGWEATRRLKADPRTKHIPLIAVTAHAMPNYEAKAWEAGCDGFLAKPVIPQELLSEMRRVLKAGGGKSPSPNTFPPKD